MQLDLPHLPIINSKKRIFWQLLGYFGLVGLIPVGIALALSTLYTTRTLRQVLTSELLYMACRQGELLADNLKHMGSITVILSKNDLVLRALKKPASTAPINLKEQAARINPILASFGIDQVFVLDNQGTIVGELNNRLESMAHFDRPPTDILEDLMTFLRTHDQVYTRISTEGSTRLYIGHRVEWEGDMIGVVMVGVSNESICDLIEAPHLPMEMNNLQLIAYQEGQIKTITLMPSNQFTPVPLNPIWITGPRGTTQVTRPGAQVPIMVAWDFLPDKDWGIAIQSQPAEELAIINRLKRAAWIIGAGVVAWIICWAGIAARGFTRPIDSLTTVATSMAHGDLTQLPGPMPNNEIGDLAEAFRAMAESIGQLIGKSQILIQSLGETLHPLAFNFTKQLELGDQLHASARLIRDIAQKLNASHQTLTLLLGKIQGTTQESLSIGTKALQQSQQLAQQHNQAEQRTAACQKTLESILAQSQELKRLESQQLEWSHQARLIALNAGIEAQSATVGSPQLAKVAEELQRWAQTGQAQALDLGQVEHQLRMQTHAAQQTQQELMDHFVLEGNLFHEHIQAMEPIEVQLKNLPELMGQAM
ncbi:MAG: hypothetical protein B7X06_02570, partial [Verrucomicrobia bacterium 21-51-4]